MNTERFHYLLLLARHYWASATVTARVTARHWRVRHHRRRRAARALLVLGLLLGGPAGTGHAAERMANANEGTTDFTELSLEELASVVVTTASKKAEKLSEVPAAVAVVSDEDIRRSGVATLPEALRLAPGTEVARVGSAEWAVSVRGFNDNYATKLLVLMDGRSVYNPLFSGVIWPVQDYLIGDLARIEVIRGPGGTVWGANAVNGVINIVSKPARETQGWFATAATGTDLLARGSLRYGTALGSNTFFRVYGKYDSWDELDAVGGGSADDAWWKGQSGFRLDWEPDGPDHLTLQGDAYRFNSDVLSPLALTVPPYNSATAGQWDQRGGNLLARWTHTFAPDSQLTVQTYFDAARISTPVLGQDLNTWDLDVRHQFQPNDRHDIVWGGGYRLNDSSVTGSPGVVFSRSSRADQIFNVFLQDELTLVAERLRLTLGAKVEHNDYTHSEFGPSARLTWTPGSRQTVWAAVSRAVRTPSQIESDARINFATVPPNPPLAPFPTVVSVVGNSGYGAEELFACELGYRVRPTDWLTLDAATFLNFYDHLRSADEQLDLTTLPGYAQALAVLDNRGHGETWGGELAATVQASPNWRLHGNLSLLEARLSEPPDGITGAASSPYFASPRWQASLRSSHDLGRQVQLDGWLRFVDEIAAAGPPLPGGLGGTRIPAYTTFDLRLAWRPRPNCEFSVTGQNLAGTHREFVPTFVSKPQREVGPAIIVRATFKF